VSFIWGIDNNDKFFIEELGVSRNFNLDNPMTFKEKTTKDEVEMIGTWLIWGFTSSIEKGMKLNKWIILSPCCLSVLGTSTSNLAQKLWSIELSEQP